MSARILAVLGGTAIVAGAAVAGPDTVVIPNVNEIDPGPSNQAFPWNQGNMRYQQLYAADQFGGLTGVIDAFAYRVDESSGSPFGPVTIVAQIWFGYSDLDPTELTTTFDENFSGAKTLVHDGPVVLSSAGDGSFDIVVDVDDEFDYDGNSNLLMEIRIPGSAFTTQFDAAGTGLGQGGTPWTDRLWAIGADSLTGSLGGDDGMVTQFIFASNGCDADCNGDGVLNILDFVCFQGAWQNQAPFGDCDGNGLYNILDFVCYQDLFQQGCP